jgi:hypothetical protein
VIIHDRNHSITIVVQSDSHDNTNNPDGARGSTGVQASTYISHDGQVEEVRLQRVQGAATELREEVLHHILQRKLLLT